MKDRTRKKPFMTSRKKAPLLWFTNSYPEYFGEKVEIKPSDFTVKLFFKMYLN